MSKYYLAETVFWLAMMILFAYGMWYFFEWLIRLIVFYTCQVGEAI